MWGKHFSICFISESQVDYNTETEYQSNERLQMEQNRKMTPESARLVSEKLIRESLKDLNNMPAKLETSDVPPDMSGRTRLLSQVVRKYLDLR